VRGSLSPTQVPGPFASFVGLVGAFARRRAYTTEGASGRADRSRLIEAGLTCPIAGALGKTTIRTTGKQGRGLRNARRIATAISTLAVALPFTMVPAAQAQQTVPPDIAPLLERERWLDGKCRGGSGDDPATADYCAVRDRAAEQLQAKGWCWGPPEQIEALKEWRPCKAASGPAACVASIDRYQRAVAIAFVATMCQLRSDRYLALFKQARDSAYFSAPSCRQLSAAENSQVDAEMVRVFVDEQSKIGLREGELSRTFAQACQVLREGHTLVDLDRQARPTGK
jgi:hypothetical protein